MIVYRSRSAATRRSECPLISTVVVRASTPIAPRRNIFAPARRDAARRGAGAWVNFLFSPSFFVFRTKRATANSSPFYQRRSLVRHREKGGGKGGTGGGMARGRVTAVINRISITRSTLDWLFCLGYMGIMRNMASARARLTADEKCCARY